jgi:hypothetical protein
MSATRRVNAARTYLTGFSHEVTHDEYVRLGEIAGGAEYDLDTLSDNEREGSKLLGEGDEVWMRPAYDGLRISVKASADGSVEVTDGSY